LGAIEHQNRTQQGSRLAIRHPLGELELGESIAINGVCLTVVEHTPSQFQVDVSRETLRVTSLDSMRPGSRCNLERALKVGDRLGGHLVSGHVDGLARVVALEPSGESVAAVLRAPSALAGYIAEKGSVTLDGVSLTVNQVLGDDFEVMLIPHTRAVTTLGQLVIDQRLNLEVDVLARYVRRCLQVAGGLEKSSQERDASLEAALKRSGFI